MKKLSEQKAEAKEDEYFSKLADERIKDKKGMISHKEFWSKDHTPKN